MNKSHALIMSECATWCQLLAGRRSRCSRLSAPHSLLSPEARFGHIVSPPPVRLPPPPATRPAPLRPLVPCECFLSLLLLPVPEQRLLKTKWRIVDLLSLSTAASLIAVVVRPIGTMSKEMEGDDIEFSQAGSGASATYPVQCSALRKNGYVMIKGRPCKVMEMSTSKTGKHGHAKVHLVALDIFTQKKYEDLCPSTHNIDVPHVTRQEYTVSLTLAMITSSSSLTHLLSCIS